MESPKKPNRPSWADLAAACREQSPPPIDVRASVQARIRYELSLERGMAPARARTGPLDSIRELFARPFAKVALGGALVAMLAFASSTAAELVSQPETTQTEDFEVSMVQKDWSEYL